VCIICTHTHTHTRARAHTHRHTSWSRSTKARCRQTGTHSQKVGILWLRRVCIPGSLTCEFLFCSFGRYWVDLMSGLQLDSIPEKDINYIRDFVPLVRSIEVCTPHVICLTTTHVHHPSHMRARARGCGRWRTCRRSSKRSTSTRACGPASAPPGTPPRTQTPLQSWKETTCTDTRPLCPLAATACELPRDGVKHDCAYLDKHVTQQHK